MREMLSPLIAFVSSLGVCPCAWILLPVPHLPVVVPIPPAGPVMGWAL